MRARLVLAMMMAAGLGACAKTVITSPTATTAAVDPNAFTNQVPPGGSASRLVTITSSGRLAVTLTQTTPPGLALGVGIGIPRSNNQCAVGASVTTTAGSTAQVASAVDGGNYCVKVFDPGTLTAPATFTVSISRP